MALAVPGKILFISNEDLLAITHRYQAEGRHFASVVYVHQLRLSVGRCISDLEIISKGSSVDEMANRVEFLPL